MDFKVTFSPNIDPHQMRYIHPKLYRPLKMILDIATHFDCEAVITSIIRPKNSISGESNVHATGRAIDLVLKFQKRFLDQEKFFKKIAYLVCKAYPRADRKPTCLFHNSGTGWHFHIQWPMTKDYKDFDGFVPEGEPYRNGVELE